MILLVQSFRIYFLGCILVYLERLLRLMAFGCCVLCGRPYKDTKFPAEANSIGILEGKKSLEQVASEIGWERVGKVCVGGGQQGAKLFSGGIKPSDICQGQLGDCWLMSGKIRRQLTPGGD